MNKKLLPFLKTDLLETLRVFDGSGHIEGSGERGWWFCLDHSVLHVLQRGSNTHLIGVEQVWMGQIERR